MSLIASTTPSTPCPEGAVRLADWGLIRASGADAAASCMAS
jgi:hypothetical protein